MGLLIGKPFKQWSRAEKRWIEKMPKPVDLSIAKAQKPMKRMTVDRDHERKQELLAFFATAELARRSVRSIWLQYLRKFPDGISLSKFYHHLNDFTKQRAVA